jgi:nitrogen fixation/metabolism regulation signal transduction histidine kinase
VTLRRALLSYLLALHLIIAGCGALLLWPEHRPWLLVLEAGLAFSLAGAFLLLRALRMPEELYTIGMEWMKEGDFSHSFRPAGTSDLQQLTTLYNQLLERLRSEQTRLEEREVFLHKVLDASPSGIITTDHDGAVDLVSPAAAQLLGVTPDELLGHHPQELEGSLLQQLAAVPQGSSLLLWQGGLRRLRCSHSRFFDRGHPRSFFVIEDLTHELWQSEKIAYNTLIRTLSHEVNNTIGATGSILRSALTYGDQLRAEDRDDFANALHIAIERTANLNSFMQRYAEVVRVPPPLRQPADVGQLLQRLISLMEPECRRHQVTLALALEVEAEAGTVAIDTIQIEQVLVNVIRNALEAIGSQGQIRIRLHGQPPVISIEDSGPGLCQEARDNLFTPFYSSKPQGQGVGLTLVREILTQHGFDFALESPPDGPTTFTIQMT